MSTTPLTQHAGQNRGDVLMGSELSQVRSARPTVSHNLAINYWWLWHFLCIKGNVWNEVLVFTSVRHPRWACGDCISGGGVTAPAIRRLSVCLHTEEDPEALVGKFVSFQLCEISQEVDPGEMAPWVIHPFSRRISRFSNSLGSNGGSMTKNTATDEWSSPQERLALYRKILFRTGNWTRAAFVLTDKTFSERQIKPFAAATYRKAFNQPASLNGKLKNIKKFRYTKWFIMKW